MKDYEHLGQSVYHLDSHYIQPGVASLYAVVADNEVAFIDTGTSYSLPYVQRFLSDLQLQPAQVKYVIPTHVHLDHAGGTGAMMQAFPQAQLVIHPRGARHMVDPTKLIDATMQVYGESKFKKLYGVIPPVDDKRVIAAEHQACFKLGDRELLIIDTPGHAYHHFCVVDPASQGIFSGDTFGLSYPNLSYQGKRIVFPTTTPTQFNPQALMTSIDLLMSFNPARMYLTHFNMLPDPDSVVDQYRLWIEKFVDLTEKIQPQDDASVDVMVEQMGEMIANEFELPAVVLKTQLAMDIKLNCQGLAYWYQKQ